MNEKTTAIHGLVRIADVPFDEEGWDVDPVEWMVECAREHLDLIAETLEGRQLIAAQHPVRYKVPVG